MFADVMVLYSINFSGRATTLSMKTFGIMTLSIKIFSIMTISIKTFSIMTLSITAFIITNRKCDTQYDNTHQNHTRCLSRVSFTWSVAIRSIILRAVLPNVVAPLYGINLKGRKFSIFS